MIIPFLWWDRLSGHSSGADLPRAKPPGEQAVKAERSEQRLSADRRSLDGCETGGTPKKRFDVS